MIAPSIIVIFIFNTFFDTFGIGYMDYFVTISATRYVFIDAVVNK